MKKYFPNSWGTLILVLSLVATSGHEACAFQVISGQGALILMVRLPKGYEFIPGAPFSLEADSAAPDVVTFPTHLPGRFNPLAGHYRIPFATHPGTALITIKAKVFYCDKISKMCFQNIRETRITFEVAPNGSSTILFLWDLAP